jgi:hypothetical protein
MVYRTKSNPSSGHLLKYINSERILYVCLQVRDQIDKRIREWLAEEQLV